MSFSLIIAKQYLTLGNIGLIFNIFFFGQSIHRRNSSCSLYILTMSFCSLIGLNSAIIPNVIPSVALFWLLLAIFPTILHSIIDGVCDAMSGLPYVMYSVYILTVLGILPIVSMVTFGVLLTINLKKMRTRIHSIANLGNAINVLRKRDRDMLVELIIYICTTMPNTIVLIYMVSAQTTTENYESEQINSFVSYFARVFLLYLNNSLSS
jgi:hypothetical protein